MPCVEQRQIETAGQARRAPRPPAPARRGSCACCAAPSRAACRWSPRAGARSRPASARSPPNGSSGSVSCRNDSAARFAIATRSASGTARQRRAVRPPAASGRDGCSPRFAWLTSAITFARPVVHGARHVEALVGTTEAKNREMHLRRHVPRGRSLGATKKPMNSQRSPRASSRGFANQYTPSTTTVPSLANGRTLRTPSHG